MKVIVLGTNHGVQEKDYKGTSEFRAVIKYLIRELQIEIVMEEWTSSKGSTVGQRLASDLKLQWFNVGSPSVPELETFIPLFASMEEPPLVIGRYGPLGVHVKREEHMVSEINKAMIGRTCGLFIVGLAHLASMSEKLLNFGYDVEAFSWTEPPVRM